MRRIGLFAVVGVAVGGVLLAVMPAFAPARTKKHPHVCHGTASKPGVLSGRYASGVDVKGYCAVNSGPAHVIGKLKLEQGSVLLAAFGMKHSKLKVTGDLKVNQGATLVLGCNTTSSPCIDDPSQSHPTLSSFATVTGDINAFKPLGVIVHSTTVGGKVDEFGGGGGMSCAPPSTGPFASFHSPVFSAWEDNTIAGHLYVTDKESCWLGVIRNHVGGALKLVRDKMADPDAIEVESNHVHGNLFCLNDRPHVWDSSETGNSTYPRELHRNHVHGSRIGQCQKAGPLTQGGPPAGGPF
jgi:hypothetical protein